MAREPAPRAVGLRPTGDRVLIRPDTQTPPYAADPAHQIVLPERYAYGPWDVAHVGTVVALGPSVTVPLTVGDRVRYGKWSFAKFPHAGQEWVIVHQADILVVEEA